MLVALVLLVVLVGAVAAVSRSRQDLVEGLRYVGPLLLVFAYLVYVSLSR